MTSEKAANKYVILAVIILLGVFIFYSLMDFFTAFLGAVILYVLSKPFVNWLVDKKKWSRRLASVAVIIISFFIILLPMLLLVTMVYSKINSLAANPNDIIDKIKHFDDTIESQTGFQLLSDDTINSIKSYATTLLTTLLSGSFNFFSTIIMMYFFLYFMITGGSRLEAGLVLILPFKREKVQMFGRELTSQTFSNAIGIPLIAVAQGTLAYIAYMIAGVEEAGFWAVITGMCSVIPIVGAGLIWAPIAIYQLVTGNNWQGIFILLWSILLLGTIDNVIRFMLAKRMADVHPVVTVLGVIMGLKYFGFTGLIFGPLIISYFILLMKIYYGEYRKPAPSKTTRQQKARQLMPTYMQPFLGKKK